MYKIITLDTSKISRYIDNGKFHKDWYPNEVEKLINLLPEFEELPIIRSFAVTSMTTSIEANVHLAIKALQQMKRGETIKGFLPAQITYLNLVKNGFDVPGRKIGSFIKALEGDVDSVVVDIWMCRAFGTYSTRMLRVGNRYRKYGLAPTKREYDTIENYCIKDAKRLGIEPRQYQSIIWAGIRRDLGIKRNVTWSDLLIKKKGMFSYI